MLLNPQKFVWLICGLIIIAISESCAKKQPFKFIFTNATSDFNPEFISNYTPIILPKIPGTIMELPFDVIKNYTMDPMINFSIHMMGPDKKYQRLFDIVFDYCLMAGTNEKVKINENVNVATVMTTWIENIKRHSNLPACPVTTGHYGLEKLKPETKSLPPFILSGKYIIESKQYFKTPYTLLKHVKVFVEFKRHTKA